MRRSALIALLALQCASRTPEARPAARVVVETRTGARHVVAVELARTDAERERGLMFRRELALDAGMLFLFDESVPHQFWMKNTLIPLDMIFIGEDRAVGAPSRYVLEVNGGWSAAHGVRAGDRVRFEGVSRF